MPTQASGLAATAEGRPNRVPALDVARALGVVAMVFGHTCDALLSPAARAAPGIAAYWKARGLTAPLFLMVSGWAVTLAVSRSPARGVAVIRARLPRVILLLGLGYALRFPGWNVHGLLTGDTSTWRHLLAFDALHAIAGGLFIAGLTLALPWSRREKGLAFIALAALAVPLGMLPPSFPSAVLAMVVAQAQGGSSPFPVFPWVAYFFFGAAIPLLTDDRPIRRALTLAGVGIALVAFTWRQGLIDMPSMPPAYSSLVMFRVGAVFVLVAVLETCSARVARALTPLGRSSLGLYAIHLPIVYGWSTMEGLSQRVGARLSFPQASLVAVAVLVAALGAERTMRLAGAGARRVWARHYGIIVVRVSRSLRGFGGVRPRRGRKRAFRSPVATVAAEVTHAHVRAAADPTTTHDSSSERSGREVCRRRSAHAGRAPVRRRADAERAPVGRWPHPAGREPTAVRRRVVVPAPRRPPPAVPVPGEVRWPVHAEVRPGADPPNPGRDHPGPAAVGRVIDVLVRLALSF